MKEHLKMETNKIILGNCLEKLKCIEAHQVDLVYFDPPFFTQKTHSLSNSDNTKTYEFDDKYDSLDEYLLLIEKALIESKRILKDTGSVFLHCDKTASHHIRTVLDKIFGKENFHSEIVWSYKRWSNAKKGLLNARIKSMEKQEDIIKEKSKELQSIIIAKIESEKTGKQEIAESKTESKPKKVKQ